MEYMTDGHEGRWADRDSFMGYQKCFPIVRKLKFVTFHELLDHICPFVLLGSNTS